MSTIDGLLEGFWLTMAAHLWQSTLVLGVIFLLARLMRRAPARLLQIVWWSALLKLLLPLPLLGPAAGRLGADLSLAAGAVRALPFPGMAPAVRTFLDPLSRVTLSVAAPVPVVSVQGAA